LKHLGVDKRIGWHSFRHGMSNLLRDCGIDVKVVQDLLRHASSKITLDIYQQTVTPERRHAQAIAFKKFWLISEGASGLASNRTLANPRRPQKEEVIPLIN
jgi:hypothetical protein